MTKFKGTKGSWKVQHSQSKTAFNVIGTVLGGNYKIARCPYLVEKSMSKEWNESEKAECEANAKLIAAAPDLLEALQSIVDYWNTPQKGSLQEHVDNSLKIAEIAIKKATD